MQVVNCRRSELAAALQTAHIALPMMARLDRAALEAAPCLRMILQFGVGMEGCDIPAV